MALVRVPAPGGGMIALCPLPQTFELDELKWWRARALVTLAEQRELQFFGAKDLGKQAEKLGMQWHHLPIPDMGIPDGTFEVLWSVAAPQLHKILRVGGRIAVHCRAGMGRTGMIAARLLVEMGETPEAAMSAVRKAKPGAIETDEQEAYVRACKRVPGA